MRIPAPHRRRRLALVAAAAAVAVLSAACGGSSDETAAPDVKQDGKTSAFPVTIAQKLGEVTIEAEPERVLALDYPSADNAIALGVIPVGMAEVTYVEGGVQAWTRAALGDHQPEIFNVDDGFPFETIAKLDPDVILTQVGKALGRSAQAARLISGVESQIARARTAHPEFAAKTVSFFRYMGPDGLWVISSPEDFSVAVGEERVACPGQGTLGQVVEPGVGCGEG